MRLEMTCYFGDAAVALPIFRVNSMQNASCAEGFLPVLWIRGRVSLPWAHVGRCLDKTRRLGKTTTLLQ